MQSETFNIIWDKGILRKGVEIVDNNVGKVEFDKKAKDRIFNEYSKLRDYCKLSYMRNPDGILDRHKVCSCLIIAIIKAEPLVYAPTEKTEEKQVIYNENLAMSVGLSLLHNYILSANCEDEHITKAFEKGFVFPETTLDTRYQELLCLMLHFDIQRNSYSILALANILYLIEEYTKLAFRE